MMTQQAKQQMQQQQLSNGNTLSAGGGGGSGQPTLRPVFRRQGSSSVGAGAGLANQSGTMALMLSGPPKVDYSMTKGGLRLWAVLFVFCFICSSLYTVFSARELAELAVDFDGDGSMDLDNELDDDVDEVASQQRRTDRARIPTHDAATAKQRRSAVDDDAMRRNDDGKSGADDDDSSDDNEQKTIDNTNKPNEEALFASLTAKLKMKLRALTSGEKVDDDVDEASNERIRIANEKREKKLKRRREKSGELVDDKEPTGDAVGVKEKSSEVIAKKVDDESKVDSTDDDNGHMEVQPLQNSIFSPIYRLQQRQPKHSKLAGSGGGRKIRRSIDATSDQVESIMEPNVEKENDGDEDRKARKMNNQKRRKVVDVVTTTSTCTANNNCSLKDGEESVVADDDTDEHMYDGMQSGRRKKERRMRNNRYRILESSEIDDDDDDQEESDDNDDDDDDADDSSRQHQKQQSAIFEMSSVVKTRSPYKRRDITNRDDHKYRDILDRADYLVEKHQYMQAFELFDRVLTANPNSPRAHYGCARAYDIESDLERSNALLEKAIFEYERVINNDDTPDALYRQAVEHLTNRARFRGWMSKAINAQRALIDRFPDEIQLQNDYGVTFLMMGRNDDARKVFQNVLDIDPLNGFAQVHYGFILKSIDGNIEEGVKYLRKGIKSEADGTIDARFYYNLGDGLQRLGRSAEANRIYEEGAALGLFLSKYQRSLYNVPGLQAHPMWSIEQTTYGRYLKPLEKQWQAIRDEALSILNDNGRLFEVENEQLTVVGQVRQYVLYSHGKRLDTNCARAPRTCAIVDRFESATKCTRGQIKFSLMQGNTRVWSHCGPTNCRLRAHLGLDVPTDARIRVANETRTWKRGKLTIFDDSFEHEMWNDSAGHRLVLVVDFWHPDLSVDQRRTLGPI